MRRYVVLRSRVLLATPTARPALSGAKQILNKPIFPGRNDAFLIGREDVPLSANGRYFVGAREPNQAALALAEGN